MAALDVVSVDLQLRFGSDLRVVREQETLVGLVGVRPLGHLVDVYLAPEDAASMSGKNALVELVADAVGTGVLDAGVVVDVLFAAGEEEAVEGGIDALAIQYGGDVVANEASAERDVVRGEVAAPRLGDVEGGDVVGAAAFSLDLVVLETGFGTQDDLGDRVGQVHRRRLEAGVALDYRSAGTILSHDEGAGIGYWSFSTLLIRAMHRVFTTPRRGQVEQMDGGVEARRQVDEGAIANEGGVEGREAFLNERCVMPQMGFDEIGDLLQSRRHTADEDARVVVGERGLLRRQGGREVAVHENQLGANQAGIGERCQLIGTQARRRRIGCVPEGGTHHGGDIGVAPALVPPAGEAGFGKAIDGYIYCKFK